MRGVRLGIGVLLLAMIAPTGAGAAEKAIWGPLDLPGGASAFPTYRDLGVDTLQMQLNFATSAPQRPANPADPADPAYRWPADIDRAAGEAQAAGIDLALLVSLSPGWANGGQSAIHAPDPQAFADFVAAAARRYPGVHRWMIWGEPNRDDRFLPNGPAGPPAYSRVLDAAYGALKGVSADNVVIGGMTWTGGTIKPAIYMRDMRLPDGRRPRLDWFGHNPFPFRFPDLRNPRILEGWRDISDMDTFTRQLHRTFGRSKRFWLSEFLVLSGRKSREFDLFVSEIEQAQWLAAGYRIADALPSIAGLGWLGLLDERQAAGSSNYGLLTDRGARKPSYRAYRAARSERFRPRVKAPRRGRAGAPLTIRVTPRLAGRVTAELRSRIGRRVARSARRLRANRRGRLRLRGPRGRYALVVRAPRGATVRRSIRLR